MNIDIHSFIEIIKVIATVSIFFVWFVRYDNIKKEFDEYNFPKWFRDLVGILKISFIIMLHSSDKDVILVGASGISFLMIGAVITHVRMKSNFKKYIASVCMLSISSLILYYTIVSI